MEVVLSILKNEAVIAALITGVLGIVGYVFRDKLTPVRKELIAKLAFHAFNGVNDIAKTDPREDGWDKVAEGLRIANEWMAANGWRKLTPQEEELMKLHFKSLHGLEAKALEIQRPTTLPPQ